jgi:hypothetical protein
MRCNCCCIRDYLSNNRHVIACCSLSAPDVLHLQWYKAEDVLCGEEIAYTLFTLAQVGCSVLLLHMLGPVTSYGAVACMCLCCVGAVVSQGPVKQRIPSAC